MFGFTPAEKFYIIVSNLAFNDFGNVRFKQALPPFVVDVIMGDLFFSPKTNIAQLAKAFRIVIQAQE